MYIFLLAEAVDTKRRRDVAIRSGVHEQISNMSSNYLPMSMKVNEKRQVVCLESDLHNSRVTPLHHVIIVFFVLAEGCNVYRVKWPIL